MFITFEVVYVILWIFCALCIFDYYNTKRIKDQESLSIIVIGKILVKVVAYATGDALLLTIFACYIFEALGIYHY